jgi:hypothetical protein
MSIIYRLVRSPGFEPGSSAWEADVLPSWTTTAHLKTLHDKVASYVWVCQSYFFQTFNLTPLIQKYNSQNERWNKGLLLCVLFFLHKLVDRKIDAVADGAETFSFDLFM